MRIPWAGRGSPTRFRRGSPTGGRKWRLLLVPVMGLAVICQLSVTGSVAATAATTAKAAVTSVAPNPVNELDCNGWSPKYGTVKKLAGDLCTDPIKVVNGKGERFVDNKWYVGHDEPSVKFISSTRGSGNTMTYLTKIPVDPRKAPTHRAASPTTASCPSRPGSGSRYATRSPTRRTGAPRTATPTPA